MKSALLAPLLLAIAVPSAQAAFYQWVDAHGVVHFTDDARKIPLAYRKKARKLNLTEQPAPAGGATARQPASPPQPEPDLSAPGGHTQQWWRQRFSALRAELKALQDGMPQKQEKLVELRRQRTIYQRGRDRAAWNEMQAEISADETRIGELQKQIAALELEASRAAVPTEWRH